MSDKNYPQDLNKNPEEFSKDIAYIENDPKAKKPRKIPFFKIIIYSIILLIVLSVLVYVLYLLRNPEKFEKIGKEATSEIQSKLQAYPKPLPNACGEDVKMCESGDVVEKSGINCEFVACPEFSSDMTRFWNVKNSNDKYVRTYENLDLNYKFNLVKNWGFKGLDYGFILYSPNYNCENVVVSSQGTCDGTIIEMLTSNTTAKNDIEKWYLSNGNYFRINSDNKWPENYNIISISDIKAIEVENALNNLSYFFIHDNTVFALKVVSASELDFKNSKETVNQIINSFRFISTD